jgi:LCP family protein required for cell wall assembly
MAQARPLGSGSRGRAPTARSAELPTVSADVRRLVPAFLSAVVPGLGQAMNGRKRLAKRLAYPFLALAAIVGLLLITQSPTRLIVAAVAPSTMTALLILNVLVLAWRAVAVLQAFFDSRHAGRPGRFGAVGLAVVLIAVSGPHALAHVWGSTAKSAFERVFIGDERGGDSGPGLVASGPGYDERLNILIIGLDKAEGRTATLTDTLMVVSIDPVGETVSMLSIPRDLVDVPLPDGTAYTAKINSLYSHVENHPAQYPEGGPKALQGAIGTLLGIPIHYYALMEMMAFVEMVDTVGGLDLDVPRGFTDPVYDGLGLGKVGYTIEPGPHHFNGFDALAYVRTRRGPTETDFTRAARQQEMLIALRDKMLNAGSLLVHLPQHLETLGKFVRTDLPQNLLPALAGVADSMDRGAIARAVLMRPYVKGGVDERGSVQRPVLDKIRELAAQLFTAPGVLPAPLATPVPSVTVPSAPAASP